MIPGTPSRQIPAIVDALERFGMYDFRSDGYIRIERWKAARALAVYRETLLGMKGSMEGEPLSSTIVTEATVSWKAEPAEIGYRVRQHHVGVVRPEFRDIVTAWDTAGKPYPSGGGFYYSVPNKSFKRIQELQKFPELRDIIRFFNLEEDWIRFWDIYLPLRADVSKQMLALVTSKRDPEAFSRHNEQAGTGLSLRGMRLKRADLVNYADSLDFLIPYAYSMGLAFAAVQLAALEPSDVWVINVYDPRIRGAIASRSDMDVTEVNWNGEHLTVDGVTSTRQAGSDGSGTLANSDTEKRLLGQSVTEYVLRHYKKDGVDYPFSAKDLLLQIWAADAKPFPGKPYVIGQDLGLSEPISAGADNLFSRGFVRMSGKLMPLMLSGSGWTQAVYGVFHNHFITKGSPGDRLLALGDDLNLLTKQSTQDMFQPYTKVKSTKPDLNQKKVLGLYTAMSVSPDPEENAPAQIGVVPRVIKTVSSASKLSSVWAETLSGLEQSGIITLNVPAETDELIKRDLPLIKKFLFWRGPRRDLMIHLRDTWSHITPEDWAALLRYSEDLQYRLRPEEDQDTPDGP